MYVNKAEICRQWEVAVQRLYVCLCGLVVFAVELFAPALSVLAQNQEQQIP